jgi:uncharacterized coiled-coil protein SlyX
MTDPDAAVRMAELESRLAEQDRMIADLNEMVIAQWRKIDGLDRRFSELRDAVDTAALTRTGAAETPPPHY